MNRTIYECGNMTSQILEKTKISKLQIFPFLEFMLLFFLEGKLFLNEKIVKQNDEID